ncbi:MAG: hypothetical protein AVDCRST_MAG04-1386 [uncultured Acetobacteraceae bacterium]|uniref:Uncharacterized protein n=1 Tax=uncultured Acetobacteraceae bacterium TaxID=169975 RepID=A0A6J4HZP7_9PROT|nr:MAG: hypothetical protein AVDCRST_MAG04-1386 [uncultured Acetobacteraceae bacterium]
MATDESRLRSALIAPISAPRKCASGLMPNLTGCGHHLPSGGLKE